VTERQGVGKGFRRALCVAAALCALGAPASASALDALNPDRLDFGRVSVGKTSGPQAVTFTRQGCIQSAPGVCIPSAPPVQIGLPPLEAKATGDFQITADDCAAGLPTPALQPFECTISVVFDPTRRGLRRGELSFGNLTVRLKGIGLPRHPGCKSRFKSDPERKKRCRKKRSTNGKGHR
jgi:hypothetical protein